VLVVLIEIPSHLSTVARGLMWCGIAYACIRK
jgi:hypothetical protein